MQYIYNSRLVYLLILFLGLFLLFSLSGMVKKNINRGGYSGGNSTPVEQTNYVLTGEDEEINKQVILNDTNPAYSIKCGDKEVLKIVL